MYYRPVGHTCWKYFHIVLHSYIYLHSYFPYKMIFELVRKEQNLGLYLQTFPARADDLMTFTTYLATRM